MDIGDSTHGYCSDVLSKGVIGVLKGWDLAGGSWFWIITGQKHLGQFFHWGF